MSHKKTHNRLKLAKNGTFKKGKRKEIVLQAGDVLYIPQRGQNRSPGILELLNPLSFLYSIFR